MVNTFVIHTINDTFVRLNRQRLGKQRGEALQILNVLLDAIYISEVLNLPKQPTGGKLEDDIKREKWLASTITEYKKFVKIRGSKLVRETRIISGGWAYHTATSMWVGYEDALKDYINRCIREWVRRGYKNNMKTYVVEYPVVYPWWVANQTFLNSQISALLRKELVRKEPEWYWKMPDLVHIKDTPWFKKGFLWVKHLSISDRIRLCNGELLPELCDKQTNDFT